MPNCKKCKKQIEKDENYCSFCGTKNEASVGEQYVDQPAVFNCTQCGSVLPSLTNICSFCGAEHTIKKVSQSFQEFINKLNEYDLLIAKKPTKKDWGWSTWKFSDKILAVIVIILLWGIPLIVYLILPFVFFNLNSAEKKKSALISNYAFPNNREEIIEGLMYIKNQVAMLDNGKFNVKTRYWLKIWTNKAKVLFQKSQIVMTNDNVAKNIYNDIISINKNYKKHSILRIAIVVAMVIIIALVITFLNGGFNTISDYTYVEPPKNYDVTYVWPKSDLLNLVPEPNIDNGKILYESERYSEFELYKVTEQQYEDYINACRDKGFTNKLYKYSNSFNAYNELGNKIYIYYYSEKLEMTVTIYAVKDDDGN